jgi:hypothetical protein
VKVGRAEAASGIRSLIGGPYRSMPMSEAKNALATLNIACFSVALP